MTIFHIHTWGWPRRRGDRDVQVCTKCGAERDSKIQFPVSAAGGSTNNARDVEATRAARGMVQ